MTGTRLSARRGYVGSIVKCLKIYLFIHCFFYLGVVDILFEQIYMPDQKCTIVKECDTMNHNYFVSEKSISLFKLH